MTMSKTKQNEAPQHEQPAFIEELLTNGTAVLTAPQREDLDGMLSEIPEGCRFAVGAVGRSNDGSTYSLRVDIIQ